MKWELHIGGGRGGGEGGASYPALFRPGCTAIRTMRAPDREGKSGSGNCCPIVQGIKSPYIISITLTHQVTTEWVQLVLVYIYFYMKRDVLLIS